MKPSTYIVAVSAALLAVSATPAAETTLATSQHANRLQALSDKPVLVAATCFKTGERTSGMNKICYYDCLGSETAITISSIELCPLTIRD